MRAMPRLARSLGAAVLLATMLAPSARAVVTAQKPAPARAALHQVLPWIDDDYTRAVAEAKARKVPIFVESWAPW